MLRVKIEELLKTVNGNRRTRTMAYFEVRATILCAVDRDNKHGWSSECAGEVANAYKDRAVTTACLAVNLGPKVALHIGLRDAHRGSSPTTWATNMASNKCQQESYFHWLTPADIEDLKREVGL